MKALLCLLLLAGQWPQFRGPDGSGLAQAGHLPIHFGKGRNLQWRTEVSPGQSSPVLSDRQVFVTAYTESQLLVIALDRETGRVDWQRALPRTRNEYRHRRNDPAAPTPVTDGRNVFAFFADFGLISFDQDGNENWRLPLGPFKSMYGVTASPVLSGRTLVMLCDQHQGSFLLAVDAASGEGKVAVIVAGRDWKVEAVNDLAEPIRATPAIAGRQIVIRTSQAVYCFATME